MGKLQLMSPLGAVMGDPQRVEYHLVKSNTRVPTSKSEWKCEKEITSVYTKIKTLGSCGGFLFLFST